MHRGGSKSVHRGGSKSVHRGGSKSVHMGGLKGRSFYLYEVIYAYRYLCTYCLSLY